MHLVFISLLILFILALICVIYSLTITLSFAFKLNLVRIQLKQSKISKASCLYFIAHIIYFCSYFVLYIKLFVFTVVAHGCEIPKKIVHIDVHNIQRLVFPEVIKSMQAHFNCSESEFGAPLDPYKGEGSSSNEDVRIFIGFYLTYSDVLANLVNEI